MPQLKRQFAETDVVESTTAVVAAPARGSAGTIASLTGEIDWAASPARQMHDELMRVFGTADQKRVTSWSRGQKLAFIGGTSLLLWGVIGVAVAAVL